MIRAILALILGIIGWLIMRELWEGCRAADATKAAVKLAKLTAKVYRTKDADLCADLNTEIDTFNADFVPDPSEDPIPHVDCDNL